MTSDLHLVVDTSHELQSTIRPIPNTISRAIQPLAVGKRMRQEALRGQPGATEIAACQAIAPDEQLTDNTPR